MSDLEEAAHAAVLAVRALRQRLDEARGACDRSLERVGTLRDTVESDTEALDGALPVFDTAVEESARQLTDGVAAAETALSEVAQATAAAATDAHHALDAEAGALDGLAESLEFLGAQVDGLARAAGDAGKAAADHAVGVAGALDVIAERAASQVSDYEAFTGELFREITNAGIAAKSVWPGQYVPVLKAADEEFAAKTGEVPVALKKLFKEMEKHAEEVAEYSLGQFRQFVDDEKAAIEEGVQALAIELEELTRQAGQEAEDVKAAGGSLVQDLGHNAEAAGRLTDSLYQVRGRWVLFGFWR